MLADIKQELLMSWTAALPPHKISMTGNMTDWIPSRERIIFRWERNYVHMQTPSDVKPHLISSYQSVCWCGSETVCTPLKGWLFLQRTRGVLHRTHQTHMRMLSWHKSVLILRNIDSSDTWPEEKGHLWFYKRLGEKMVRFLLIVSLQDWFTLLAEVFQIIGQQYIGFHKFPTLAAGQDKVEHFTNIFQITDSISISELHYLLYLCRVFLKYQNLGTGLNMPQLFRFVINNNNLCPSKVIVTLSWTCLTPLKKLWFVDPSGIWPQNSYLLLKAELGKQQPQRLEF